jgi:hypothetical protein
MADHHPAGVPSPEGFGFRWGSLPTVRILHKG